MAGNSRWTRSSRRGASQLAPAMGGLIAISLILLASAGIGSAASESVLYNFSNSNGGYGPGGLIVDHGVLYGSNHVGLNAGVDGTIFSLTPPATSGDAWTEQTLYAFAGGSDGSGPEGPLFVRDHTFYGTTENMFKSYPGTVYGLIPPRTSGGKWIEKVLYTFTGGVDGYLPSSGVVGGSSGPLYGTTIAGGASSLGTVFALTPPASPGGSWTESVLHSFAGGADGLGPAGLLLAKGVLYGTTQGGGTSNEGTVFELTPPTSLGGAWSESVLYSFAGGNAGRGPMAGLIISGGVLYGTTVSGGASDAGTVFALTPPASTGGTWTETILYSFGSVPGDAENPQSIVLKDGTLYGTTGSGGDQSNGTVFSLTPAASPGPWNETILYSFAASQDGVLIQTGLIAGPNGALYGTTYAGGPNGGGTVYEVTP